MNRVPELARQRSGLVPEGVEMSRPKLPALTGLRYVAALTVLFAHMSWNLPPGAWKKYTVHLAGVGMSVFFVLSGFLMAYNYADGFRARYRGTLRSYLAARVARIYPVYLLALLFWFSFVGNFFHDLRDHPGDTAQSLGFVLTGTQSWVYIPVFQGSHAPRTVTVSFMAVGWSVSTEVFFYLMFPLVVLPVARAATGAGRTLAFCGLVYAAWAAAAVYVGTHYVAPRHDPVFGRWVLYLCPYARFGEFLLGAAAGSYFLTICQTPVRRWEKWAGTVLMVVAIAVLFRLNHVLRVKPPTEWPLSAIPYIQLNILLAPLAVMIIYLLARVPTPLGRVLGSRPLVALGESSYCLYLMHPVFQSLFYPRAAGETDITGTWVVVYNNLAMVACLHFCCLGMWMGWEEPARRFLRRLLDPIRPPPATAAEVPLDRPRLAA